MATIKKTFTKSDLNSLLFEPAIYGWFRPPNTYLYIGATSVGIARFQNHNKVGVLEPFADTDEIHFFEYDTTRFIFDVETELIGQYLPVYNAMGAQENPKGTTILCMNPHCKQPFAVKRKWQKFCSKKCNNARGII